ncbi:unnamed protein product (macronuclear) [Paramecium tetraurelia]|uniref:Uncharacterized protein n=1 Tax=Paramecium tetraurelia TaxID=5888 RepID=A0BK52_PARTE|nr:uncharacterized protein GSPATT00029549001 [Paramecium tetraurelia]CAK58919.1 unnamed protein product [Paramecium tetraurelia]|eukprot:XP_001426317.1 hypothetical protein (macronuclear) [Paramecium tetraurelia strain d4-2]
MDYLQAKKVDTVITNNTPKKQQENEQNLDESQKQGNIFPNIIQSELDKIVNNSKKMDEKLPSSEYIIHLNESLSIKTLTKHLIEKEENN